MIPLSDNIRSRTTPVVTRGIILACVALFVYEVLDPAFGDHWAFKPAYLLSHQLFVIGPALVLRSMLISVFLHGGLLHIAGNMLFLWVFGDNVEDRMGHFRFLLFYLLCGIVATLAHSFSAVLGLMHDSHALEQGVVGASGAIAGVLGAYLVLVPRASIRTLVILLIFITVINIPASFFIVVWFVMQLFSGVGALTGGASNVAYWAHIGGFATGYLIARSIRDARRARPRAQVLHMEIDDP